MVVRHHVAVGLGHVPLLHETAALLDVHAGKHLENEVLLQLGLGHSHGVQAFHGLQEIQFSQVVQQAGHVCQIGVLAAACILGQPSAPDGAGIAVLPQRLHEAVDDLVVGDVQAGLGSGHRQVADLLGSQSDDRVLDGFGGHAPHIGGGVRQLQDLPGKGLVLVGQAYGLDHGKIRGVQKMLQFERNRVEDGKIDGLSAK